MRGRAAITRLVLISAALGLSAPAAMGEKQILLAGDAGAVWLACWNPDGGSWSLSVRPAGAPDWEDPREVQARELKGLGAAGDSAVLFLKERGVMRHFPAQATGHVGVKPGSDLWPPPGEGELLATCPGGGSPNDLLVLVKRAASGRSRATRPATRPTTGPTQPSAPTRPVTRPAGDVQVEVERFRHRGTWELALLRYAGQEWDELAVLPSREDVLVSAGIAAHGGAVYVLLKVEQPALLALSEGTWRTVDLPEGVDAAAGRLVSLAEGLALAAFDPSTGAVSISLLVREKWSNARPVRIGDDAAPWKGSAAPQITRFGNKLAFAWLEHGELFFGQCGLDASLTREPLKVFERTASKLSGERIQGVFFWAVLGMLLALMIWPGRSLRTSPFVLPEGMLPAPIGRRAVAFVIDMLPFAVLFLSFMVGDWEEVAKAFRSALEGEAAGALSAASFFALGGYAAYSFIMELLFGATLGKMAMRLRVVGTDGRKPTLREVALRNVSKIPELSSLILLVFIVLTRYRQRLGDKIAWTAVIDATYLPPPPTPGQTDASPPRGDDDEQRPSQA